VDLPADHRGLIFAAASSDHVRHRRLVLNTYRNAPFVIENFYSFVGLFTLLMVPAFVNSAAARDFSYRTHEIVFSTPLRRRDYLMGRFTGATLVAVVPTLGVSIGILLAKYMPWVDADRWCPVNWAAHLEGILVFAIPNTIFMCAILFAIAVLARNEIMSFIGALLLLTGYGVADSLTQNLERERIGGAAGSVRHSRLQRGHQILDGSGQEHACYRLHGMLLWNRLIWLAVGGLVFCVRYYKFSFAEKRKKEGGRVTGTPRVELAGTARVESRRGRIPPAPSQYLASVRIHFLGVVKSTSFIVISAGRPAQLDSVLVLSAREAFDGTSFPGYLLGPRNHRRKLYMFLVAMITFYAGVLVWKDRDTRMDEIHDALPIPEWLSYASRLTALVAIVMLVQLSGDAQRHRVQTWLGYHRYQIGLVSEGMFCAMRRSFFSRPCWLSSSTQCRPISMSAISPLLRS
jgi:ABC-2 type transport system permease protein